MADNFINIVLYQPEIPQNTGNIARLCVSNDLHLHLIEPLGFKMTDKYLKRSGLDYFQYLNYTVYSNWQHFLEGNQGANLWYLTTKATKLYWDVNYTMGDYLVFGPETKGLPKAIMALNSEYLIKVPMSSENARSLNLASTVQTAYYEAYRQLQV